MRKEELRSMASWTAGGSLETTSPELKSAIQASEKFVNDTLLDNDLRVVYHDAFDAVKGTGSFVTFINHYDNSLVNHPSQLSAIGLLWDYPLAATLGSSLITLLGGASFGASSWKTVLTTVGTAAVVAAPHKLHPASYRIEDPDSSTCWLSWMLSRKREMAHGYDADAAKDIPPCLTDFTHDDTLLVARLVQGHRKGSIVIDGRIKELETLKASLSQVSGPAWTIAFNIAEQALANPRYFASREVQFELLKDLNNKDLEKVSILIPQIVKLMFFESVLKKADAELLRQASTLAHVGSTLIEYLKSSKDSKIFGSFFYVASACLHFYTYYVPTPVQLVIDTGMSIIMYKVFALAALQLGSLFLAQRDFNKGREGASQGLAIAEMAHQTTINDYRQRLAALKPRLESLADNQSPQGIQSFLENAWEWIHMTLGLRLSQAQLQQTQETKQVTETFLTRNLMNKWCFKRAESAVSAAASTLMSPASPEYKFQDDPTLSEHVKTRYLELVNGAIAIDIKKKQAQELMQKCMKVSEKLPTMKVDKLILDDLRDLILDIQQIEILTDDVHETAIQGLHTVIKNVVQARREQTTNKLFQIQYDTTAKFLKTRNPRDPRTNV